MFNFKNKIAVVTGGARGIGKCIREQFEAAGATVCVIDLLPNDYFVGDLADKATLERFAAKVIAERGHVDYLINNAAPKMCGITDCSYEDFEYALKVGVTAPFYLSKLFVLLILYPLSLSFYFLFSPPKTPAFQKESFCLPKRVLLLTKRSPFAIQNESFYSPKGVLLQNHRIAPIIQSGFCCNLEVLLY